MTLLKRKSGIVVQGDKQVGTPCAFCPNIIHLHQEVNGRLHVKSGKPICVKCRILTRSKVANQIKRDKGKFDNTVVLRREKEQEQSDKHAEDVAAASQQRAGGDSKKKKALLKKLNQK